MLGEQTFCTIFEAWKEKHVKTHKIIENNVQRENEGFHSLKVIVKDVCDWRASLTRMCHKNIKKQRAQRRQGKHSKSVKGRKEDVVSS